MSDLDERVAADPTNPAVAFDQWKTSRGMYGRNAFLQNARTAFVSGAKWVRDQQVNHPWHNMTPVEAVRELRLGEASIYYAFFDVEDAANVKCPLCAQMVWVRAEGTCPDCKKSVLEETA